MFEWSGIMPAAFQYPRKGCGTIQTLILLLIVIATVAVAETRLRIPSAILLMLTGVILALIPGLPAVELAPELVLLLVLPPIVYSSARGDELAGVSVSVCG